MNRIIFILTLSAFLFSQQAEVTNIQAAQRTDGSQIVDITYDLSEDEVFEIFTITVEVSLDSGVSFTAISNAAGDIGEYNVPGIGKSIFWDFGQQFSDTYSDQVQYKITAESDAIVVVEDEGCGPVPEGDIPFEMAHVPPGEFLFQTVLTYGTCETVGNGDVNNDGGYNILDVIGMTNGIISGDEICSGSINQDGFVNILDVIILINCVLSASCGDGAPSDCFATTSMTEESIYFNSQDGNIYINSDVAIGGFQFNVVGGTILGAGGGAYEDAGFTSDYNGNMFIGYTLSGSSIPPMDGILIGLEVTNPSVVSISNVILGDQSGCSIINYIITTDDPPEIINLDCNYEIMKYEVTDLEYVVFLMASMEEDLITLDGEGVWGPYPGDEVTLPQENVQYINFNNSKISWNGNIFEVQEGYPNHPVTGVTYYGSYMFANFYGMELPTIYEWQKAAIGMLEADYPWGESIGDNISDNANYRDSGDPWDNGTTPIGYYNGDNNTTNSPSPFDTYDMSGNTQEWAKHELNGQNERILLGGHYENYSQQLYIANATYHQPDYSSSTNGFRCIRRLPAE